MIGLILILSFLIIFIIILLIPTIKGNYEKNNIIITEAKVDDIENINKLLKNKWIYNKHLTNLNDRRWVAKINNKIVATAYIKKIKWGYEVPTLSVGGLIIDENHRGKGIATLLLNFIHSELIKENIFEINAQVDIDNEASNKLFQKLNYKLDKVFDSNNFYKKILI